MKKLPARGVALALRVGAGDAVNPLAQVGTDARVAER